MFVKPKEKLKSNFKKKNVFRSCRIVLQDVLQCTVKLNILTPAQIERALYSGSIYKYDKNVKEPENAQKTLKPYEPSDDHNYFKVPRVTPTNDIVVTEDHCEITYHTDSENHSETERHDEQSNLFGRRFSSSSDSDTDESIDDIDYDGYTVINGKSVAYPIRCVEYDSDSGHGDANSFVTANGEDAHGEQDSSLREEQTKEFVHTNGNGMDYTPESTFDSSADDSEDDMHFLNLIGERAVDGFECMNGASMNCDENGHYWPSIRIFENICLKYLRNECYGTFCDFPHEFPTFDSIERALKSSSRHEIEEAQNRLLLCNDKLMSKFFTVFCKFYGREWQIYRESLRLLISVVSMMSSASIYLKEIFNGFLISGMIYSTCVEMLLLEFDDSLSTIDRLEMIWQLMIDVRNDQIVEQLKEFETVLNGDSVISAIAINKLLEIQINGVNGGDLECLRETTVNLVRKTSVVTFQKLDPSLLNEYVQNVRLFDVTATKAIKQRAKQFSMDLD